MHKICEHVPDYTVTHPKNSTLQVSVMFSFIPFLEVTATVHMLVCD
jgi:hypothetical protein